MFDMHGHATDRITMRTSNALLSAGAYALSAAVPDGRAEQGCGWWLCRSADLSVLNGLRRRSRRSAPRAGR